MIKKTSWCPAFLVMVLLLLQPVTSLAGPLSTGPVALDRSSSYRVERVVMQGMFPLIKLGERQYLVNQKVPVQWPDGTSADRGLLRAGMLVDVEFVDGDSAKPLRSITLRVE